MSGLAKTLIVSDLHLGSGGTYDIFAGGDALPLLIQRFAADGNTIILNGDSVDFLMNEDPLELEEARAVAQAEQTFSAAATQAVLKALGQVLAAGGHVVVRLGNHDIELALNGVQERMRAHLGQSAQVAARLQFERGDKPAILDVGGARILVSHGEQSDEWNKVDYPHLPGPGAPSGASHDSFRYAPGSRLVKTIMNPLKRVYGLRLIDLIKPDFQGGVLTALAVSPNAVKEVFKGSTISLLWQLQESKAGPSTFAPDDEDELGLNRAIAQAGLSKEESETLASMFGEDHGGAVSFDLDTSVLASAQLKLARSGLKAYACAQRKLAGEAGKRFYSLEPEANEWNEAKRLQQKFSVDAVVFGHTHAARWQQADGLCYLNTGTWIRLLSLPAPDASDDEWTDFLTLARRNPQLDPNKGPMVPVVTRFTAALIEPSPQGGAHVALVEFLPSGDLQIHGHGHVPARTAGATP